MPRHGSQRRTCEGAWSPQNRVHDKGHCSLCGGYAIKDKFCSVDVWQKGIRIQSLTALLIQLWLVLHEVLGTLQAIGDQWYRFHGPLRAESLASDGTVLYTIESRCHRITWMQVKTRKQRCLSDVFFQWISLLCCRDLQAELSEQVDGRDPISTDFSGRGKSRKRDVLAMCFAIHRRSNLLSDCEMHHEQHVRKCCCSKQFHVIRMWQQFSVWCQGMQSEQ